MTAIGEYRVRFDEETGELEREGTATAPGSRVVAHGRALLAVKLGGQHVYGGQGRPFSYSPARFEVYDIVREDGDGWLIVRPRLAWPVRIMGPARD